MITEKKMVQMTEEEYIQFELASDIRHEYVNGQLIDMPGESLLNIVIANKLLILLSAILNESEYTVLTQNAKLKIPDENIWFYPDLYLTRETVVEKKYVCTTAILVAEVLSDSTRTYDLTDKFIQYRKIPGLEYYIVIEPEKKILTLFSKDETGNWPSEIFTDREDEINLSRIDVRFKLSRLFK